MLHDQNWTISFGLIVPGEQELSDQENRHEVVPVLEAKLRWQRDFQERCGISIFIE